jgi:hypothetical protein
VRIYVFHVRTRYRGFEFHSSPLFTAYP